MFLEERGQPYVLAVSGKAYVWAGLRQQRIGEVLQVAREGGLVPEDAPEASFKRLSAGSESRVRASTTGRGCHSIRPCRKASRDGSWCADPSRIRRSWAPTVFAQ